MGVNCKRIKAYRAYNGLEQKEIAEKIGMSVTSYSHKEQGLKDFTSLELSKLAEVFDVPVGDLFSRDKQLL